VVETNECAHSDGKVSQAAADTGEEEVRCRQVLRPHGQHRWRSAWFTEQQLAASPPTRQAAAGTPAMHRSRSEPPTSPAKALRRWAKSPENLARVPSLRRKSNEPFSPEDFARATSFRSTSNEGRLKVAVTTTIDRFSSRTPKDSPRFNPLGATKAEVGMLALWNHSDEKLVII